MYLRCLDTDVPHDEFAARASNVRRPKIAHGSSGGPCNRFQRGSLLHIGGPSKQTKPSSTELGRPRTWGNLTPRPGTTRRGPYRLPDLRLQSCRSNCFAPTGIVTPGILRETHMWIALARSTGASSDPAFTETTVAPST